MVCLPGCLLEPIVIFANFSAVSASPCTFPVWIFAEKDGKGFLLVRCGTIDRPLLCLMCLVYLDVLNEYMYRREYLKNVYKVKELGKFNIVNHAQ